MIDQTLRCFIRAVSLAVLLSIPIAAQEKSSVVVQPGAPGQPTRVLTAETRPQLPPMSPKDVEFMQGMIMHHAQAVEMVDLIESRTSNKDVRLIGSRISQSQADEIAFMKRWLQSRGASISTAAAHSHGHHGESHQMMPGMLTPKQMDALRAAKGAEFDRLFLEGMIQHHEGAIAMVKDLFDTSGAGQDPELFNFSSDVDSGQRAEIRSMQTLLEKLRKQ